MNKSKFKQTVTKLNRLTNHSFYYDSDSNLLRINDSFCFELCWANSVVNTLALPASTNKLEQVYVIDKTTVSQARRLIDAEVNFIDLAGNAHIAHSGLYIFISGQRHKANNQSKLESVTLLQSGKAFQASGLRVIYVLLNNPLAQHLSFREIAELADVSLGSVSAAINDLSTQGFINKKARQILNREALIERWVQAYPYQLRNRSAIGRFTSDNVFFYESLKKGHGYQLSGELAAQLKYNYLTAKHTIAYADDLGIDNLLQHGRLRKLKEQEQAEVVIDIFQPTWPIEKDTLFAPELIIYSDLISSNEPRNIEIAQRLQHEL